jgi:UDP-N-acetyl-D-glucosamine dehydrogenase
MIIMPLAKMLNTTDSSNTEDNFFEAILNKIQNRKATIAIVGMGYVGLPLARAFLKQGFPLIGFDVDSHKLKTLSQGKSPYAHFHDEYVAEMLQTSRITFADDPKVLRQADAIIMCIPTPINKYDEPDLSPLIAATHTVASQLRAGQLVCLESTTYPGTTEEVLAPMLGASGYRLGQEVFLAYSPEREDPGNKHFSVSQIPKVCSGLTGKCSELAQALYGSVVDRVIMVSNPRVAEMTKLVENVQRWVNIGLMNELKIVADAFGIDLFDVVDAASTKPFGFVPYYPGPGVGGHCIPVDPHYLE